MPQPSNPSRDLLFGLLALQNGLIDQGALFAAFTAWTRDKSRSLADHLVTLRQIDEARRAAVEAIVTLHIQTLGGDIEKSLAVLDVPRSTRESLARAGGPEIESTLGHVGPAQAPTHADRDDPDRTASLAISAPAADRQRFRIVRPHARGGLGAVFVAIDGELHREVALKQIHDTHADDPFSRQRFIAEAEITGGLEHPGIVPVYGLGTNADGRPYYAMRLIKGDSLKEAIARFHADPALTRDRGRRSLELRTLLRRFTDVCNAIDYAHSRGVIHRDLKPANIVVGKHGETLVVDWGLAKSVGRADPSVGEQTIAPSSSGSSETLPGSALGTPAYMSPEQARGDVDRMSPLSDVYSLGATLYCILTGKPPFEGDDVGAILQAVQDGRFPRPSIINPTIDAALEAVCLKAMAITPEDRYETPGGLAHDLERWMADEPVTAWAEPWARKLARWLARHRTGVTAAAAAVVAGVIGLSAVLAVQSVANARLTQSLMRETEANAALASANDQLKSSKAAVQARYDLAVDAIRTFHTGVSEDFLLKEEKFKSLRDRLLNSAADFYAKLGALLGKETDIPSRRALAQSNFELAALTEKVGRSESALAAHRAVLSMREALAAEPGADTEAKVDVGRSLTAIADLLRFTGKLGEALATYRRSESLLASLAHSDQPARAALANCRTQMAVCLLSLDRTAEALAAVKRARADQEFLAAMPGASHDARRELARTAESLGFILQLTGNSAESVPEYRAAVANLEALVNENPSSAEFRQLLAICRVEFGQVLWVIGKPTAAENEFRAAMALTQSLANENPAIAMFRFVNGVDRLCLAAVLSMTGEPAAAEAELQKALAIVQKLVDENPGVPSYPYLLADVHKAIGRLLLQMGEPTKAEAECGVALSIIQKVFTDNPRESRFRNRLVDVLNNFGDIKRALGRTNEAKDAYDRAIALKESGFQEYPTDPDHHLVLARSLRRRGLILRDLGDAAGAAADFRQALSLCGRILPDFGWDLFDVACIHASIATLAGRPGSGVTHAEGEPAAVRAIEYLRRAVDAGYRNIHELRHEPALDALRQREDFRRLMMDAAVPANPIAR